MAHTFSTSALVYMYFVFIPIKEPTTPLLPLYSWTRTPKGLLTTPGTQGVTE